MPAVQRPGRGGMAEAGAAEAGVPDPPWRTPRRARAPRQPLSQDRIVEAALRVLDREGLDAVSMRRVAQELATGAASLYVHVANKEELLELMLDRIIGEIEVPPPDPSRWQEQIMELGRATRRALLAHPGIARVSLATVPVGPNALALTEGTLAILRAGGLPEREAAWALDRLSLYVASDPASVPAGGHYAALDPATGPAARAYLAGLPADRFPHTVALADVLIDPGGDDRFEFGLDLLVRGLATFRKRISGR